MVPGARRAAAQPSACTTSAAIAASAACRRLKELPMPPTPAGFETPETRHTRYPNPPNPLPVLAGTVFRGYGYGSAFWYPWVTRVIHYEQQRYRVIFVSTVESKSDLFWTWARRARLDLLSWVRRARLGLLLILIFPDLDHLECIRWKKMRGSEWSDRNERSKIRKKRDLEDLGSEPCCKSTQQGEKVLAGVATENLQVFVSIDFSC
jgi:hypothetical protein